MLVRADPELRTLAATRFNDSNCAALKRVRAEGASIATPAAARPNDALFIAEPPRPKTADANRLRLVPIPS